MRSTPSPSDVDFGLGLDSSAGAGTSHHALQLYEDDGFAQRVAARHLGEGLAAGEPALAITTDERGLCRQLAADGHDVEGARRAGRLQLLDAEATLLGFMAGGLPDRARFERVVGDAVRRASAACGGRRVRAYGDMVDALARRGELRAALALEELWSDLAARQPLALLCAYALESFRGDAGAAELERVCAAHRHVAPTERVLELDGDARPREIALLQQRARALEAELEHRRRLEAELREKMEALRRSEEALRAADRRKDEFLAMLGHELRNPLAPVLMGIQLLRLRGGDGDRGEHAVIERQLRHVVRLVDDLLDVSRVTSGKVRLNRAPVEIAAVLARAIDMTRPLLEERSHVLLVDAPRDGLLVDADAVRLTQVVANLLTNAANYTDPGGHVTLTAAREGGEVVIAVADDGEGLEPDELGHVFELFAQGERGLDRAQGGLGVGLTVARRLVELHGGTLAAHSEGRGRGSRFAVRLPAIALAVAGGAEGPRQRRLAGDPLRVLVVDDNADAAEVLAEALRVQGHEVAVANDGPGALELAAELRPQVAVLDIGLPGMDGYELARRLRALLPDPPRLVALSGYGQEQDRLASRRAGFDVHLVKPSDLDRVIEALVPLATRRGA
jgi:signal transduction histidine kinase/ActR/RegA family two-component response regulator